VSATPSKRKWAPEKQQQANDLYRSSVKGRAHTLFHSAKTRAKRDGKPFTITKEFIVEKMKHLVCEATGATLDLRVRTGRGRNPFAPSLDQILPGEGYTPDNTMVVSWAWNAMKQNFTEDELRLWLKVLRYSPKLQ
jgi:hypothetical protein